VAEERTEEELIEALKIWWQENSFKVIAAIVLVVGGYFAWQSWQQNLTVESQAFGKVVLILLEPSELENCWIAQSSKWSMVMLIR